MGWLDRAPLPLLVLATLLLGLAPFLPEPHLWQKLKMLMAGELTRPLDVFDLLLHATPAVLLVIRLIRQYVADKSN
jgi:hypothetical protein